MHFKIRRMKIVAVEDLSVHDAEHDMLMCKGRLKSRKVVESLKKATLCPTEVLIDLLDDDALVNLVDEKGDLGSGL